MTRVLELIVAIIMVFILAVIVGVFLPAQGHIQRSISISHDPQQIYDLLNNFRRFDYAGQVLKAENAGLKLSVSGAPYGPGAKVSWSGGVDHAAPTTLTNVSGSLDPTGNGQIVWGMDSSDWRGHNKQFTLYLEPTHNQRLNKVTWAYDVDYGWNLVDRYSRFFLPGAPDTLLQYGLNNLQNTMASIPNVDYSKIAVRIVPVQPQAILFVSSAAPRTLDDVDAATDKAMQQINATIRKLGVQQTGPRITLTTDYGDENYVFDVAVPISSTKISIDGKAHDLTQITAKATNSPGSAPAPVTSAGAPPPATSAGGLDAQGNLVADGNVRAGMLTGGSALEADWDGTPAGIPLMRLALKAYALTHGYTFNDTTYRYYDELVSLPSVAYDQQQFRVFLPLQGDVPEQTPEQASGKVGPLPPLDAAAWSQANAAPAADQPAPAPAEADKASKKPEKKAKARKHG